MKRIISVLLLAALLLTAVLCLTSCSKDGGAEISVYLCDRIYDFDPAGSYLDDATISVLHLIYEPLFMLDDHGKPQEAMASEYEFDEGTGDLIVHLRESYWTNGHRVTADDFVFAWKRIIDSNNSFDCAPLLYDIKNAVAIKTGKIPEGGTVENTYLHNFGAIAVNSGTLRIKFENPNVDRDGFLRNLTNISLAPVNRLVFENNQGNYWNHADNMTGYCNGPFRIKDLNTEEGYFTLARNNEYHRPKGSKKDVDHYVLPALIRTIWDTEIDIDDPDSGTPEYLDKYYDGMAKKTVFYMSNLSLKDRKNSDIKSGAHRTDTLSTYTYIFNTENPLFADAKVRRVLSQVIDRKQLAEDITFGKPASGLISDAVWNGTSSKDTERFRYVGGNLISSKPMSIEDAIEELKDVQKGAFTIYYENREEERHIAETIAAVWTAIGYQVTAEPCTAVIVKDYPQVEPGKDHKEEESSEYYASRLHAIYESREFDVIAVDYQMFSTNALTALASLSTNYHGGGVDMDAYNLSTDPNKTLDQFRVQNIARYSNPEYDALIEKALKTTDLEKRAAYLHDAEEILMEDMPVIPIIFNQTFYVNNEDLDVYVNYYGFTLFTKAKLKDYEDYFFDD